MARSQDAVFWCSIVAALATASCGSLTTSGSESAQNLVTSAINASVANQALRLSPSDDSASRFPLGIFLESDGKLYNHGDGWVISTIRIVFANDSAVQIDSATTIRIDDIYVETKEGRQYESSSFDAKQMNVAIKIESIDGDPVPTIPAWAVVKSFFGILRWAEAATPTKLVLRTNLGTWSVAFPQRGGLYSAVSKVEGEDVSTVVGAKVSGSSKIVVDLLAVCSKDRSGLEYKYIATNTDAFDGATGTIELTVPQPMWAYSEREPGTQSVLPYSPRWGGPIGVDIGPGKSSSGNIILFTGSRIKPDYFLVGEGTTLKHLRVPQSCADGK